MSRYCHEETFKLRYSDADFKDELKISELLAFAQEAACRSADELGFGYNDLKPHDFGFLVVNTYCELLRPIGYDETLKVKTWPLPPRHVIFERDYRVEDERGEVCALLASRWCLVDLKSMKLLSADNLPAHANCPYRAEKTVEVPSWKIPKPTAAREKYRMRVLQSHCDHYYHANNTRYADFFFDCFSLEELAARRVKSFQIAYVKQAKPGSELILLREDCADGSSLLEARCGEETLAQCRIEFLNREIPS